MKQSWIVGLFSTGYDLEDHRKAIIDMLKKNHIIVSAYELPEFPVETDRHSHDSCIVALKRIDIAIVIINKRSGGIYCGSDDERVSITEAEYLEAIKNGIPVFVFVKQEAFNELHGYKKEFKKYCELHSLKSDESAREQFDKEYVCKYVDKVKTLHFVDGVQNAYSKYQVSNWMDRFDDINSLKECVKGKLEGYSRALIQQLAKEQREALLNRHTSTSIGMSLRDVFTKQYYIEPPHEVMSGEALIESPNNELSESIESILSKGRSVLVYGEAGYGKTTIIAKCFSSHVDNIIESPSYVIPLFLPLRNKRRDYNFDLLEYINEELEEHLNKESYPFFNANGLNIIFYCDGFDELAESLSESDLERIRNSQVFQFPLFLTCRQQFLSRYLNVHNFSDVFAVKIQMKKWDFNTIKKYLSVFCDKKSIGKGHKQRILSLINNHQYLQQLIDTPLLMTMFLGFLENNLTSCSLDNISAVDLFEYWMKELSSREHANKPDLKSDVIRSAWKTTAWHLYMSRMNNRSLLIEDLTTILNDTFTTISPQNLIPTFDALFEKKSGCVVGTFHEQFMEYLVADLLIDSCQNKDFPYPDFLNLVLRPEINRYFRGIWRKQPNLTKEKIFTAISEQYIQHIGKTDSSSVSIRVHAAYHFCRLEANQRDSTIDQAFQIEKSTPVLQSLYFGAIKLGRLDREEEFYTLLQTEEFSKANRGYHLTYYADIIPNGTLPYNDDECSGWQGTLEAVEHHFESMSIEHFFLWRIDLFTINELIRARKDIGKLTQERLNRIGKSIHSCIYNSNPQYTVYSKKVIAEYDDLMKTWEEFS